MTVPNTSPIIQYLFSGAGDYTFPFRIFEETDIKVYHIDATIGAVTALTFSTDYTVDFTEGIDGGTVTVSWTDKTDGNLEIRRELPYTQETDWVNNNALDMALIENAFDRAVMLLQQMNTTLAIGSAEVVWRGLWASGETYEARDIIISDTDDLYVCVVGHIADTTLAADISAGYWKLVLASQELMAYKWANEAEDVVVEGGEYSALHHALKAADRVQDAQDWAEAPIGTGDPGAASASAKAWSESAEDTEVIPGSYSALHHRAKASADADATAADRVQTGLDADATAADRVQTGLDVDAAATSASNAATSASNAAASYDSFDDRYLGAKSSEPTLDNDGDALLEGALYWNTTTKNLWVYGGSLWRLAAIDSNGVVLQTDVTGSAIVPEGTTAERDDSPSPGYFRYNSTEDQFEGYYASEWKEVGKRMYSGTATISTSDWTGSGPYIATISVAPLTTSDRPIVDIDLSPYDVGDIPYYKGQWAQIYHVEASGTDELTIYSEAALSATIHILVLVVK